MRGLLVPFSWAVTSRHTNTLGPMRFKSTLTKLLTSLRRPLGASTDLLFPRSCIHCGLPADDNHFQYLCKACAKELFLCQEPSCHYCGYPFFGVLIASRACPNCLDLEPEFSEGKALFLAKGVGRSLIHELKYAQGLYVLKDIQSLIQRSNYWRNYLSHTVLVPVPLHPTKQRQRGYNQSEKIAISLAACLSANTRVQSLITRRKFTETQTKLNREQRKQNIKNAFAMRADAVLNPQIHYVLVDDVFTTGVTLNACASVLRAGGAHKIKTFTLGHG